MNEEQHIGLMALGDLRSKLCSEGKYDGGTSTPRPDGKGPDAHAAEEPYMGLMALGTMLVRQATELHAMDPWLNEEDILRNYYDASAIHGEWYRDLAQYMEEQRFPGDMVEPLYDLAIAYDDSSTTLTNYADYWKCKGDEGNMITHLLMAIRLHQCMYAMVYLALHYAKYQDRDTAQMYYEMAVKRAQEVGATTFELETMVEIVELVKLGEFVQEGGWDQSSVIYAAICRAQTKYSEIGVYHTKVRLFTALQHFAECGVCYNHALNIDFACGHCVCTDCYLKCIRRSCPYCRTDFRN